MRYTPFIFISAAAIGIALASCGSSTSSSADGEDPAASQGAPQDEAELMRQAAIEAGLPMPDEEIPVISNRTYQAGHMNLKVSGFFDIDASLALDALPSISSDGNTWIQYGKSGEAPPNATFTVGNGDMGISVGVGRFVATGTTIECEITTEVTPTRVAGQLSCPKVTGYNQETRAMGDVKIEADFEATS
jgi:hypothetical protein